MLIRRVSLFGAMALSYSLLVLNYRAVAGGSYLQTALSDSAVAWVNFTIIKRVAAAESRWDQAAYVVGGVAGSLVALWCSLNVSWLDATP